MWFKEIQFFLNALENFLYARLSTLLSVNFWINLSALFSANTVSLCSIAGNSKYNPYVKFSDDGKQMTAQYNLISKIYILSQNDQLYNISSGYVEFPE